MKRMRASIMKLMCSSSMKRMSEIFVKGWCARIGKDTFFFAIVAKLRDDAGSRPASEFSLDLRST